MTHADVLFSVKLLMLRRSKDDTSGRAVVSDGQPLRAGLDLDQLRGRGELLAQLRLPSIAADKPADYVLHPMLVEGALTAAPGLIYGESRLPFALETLRILSPCTPDMVAWVRYASGAQASDEIVKLDIDLCDERGTIAAQMRGVSGPAAAGETSAIAGIDGFETVRAALICATPVA